MDKSEMKSVFENIKTELATQNHVSFMEYINKSAWKVFNEMLEHGNKEYVFEDVKYNFEYHPNQKSLGNRTTTPSFVVTLSKAKDTFNADEFLVNREILIRDWMGGKKVNECKLSNNPIPLNDEIGDVTSIIRIIMIRTYYDIMIQRCDTGDITIWIDDKKFKQR